MSDGLEDLENLVAPFSAQLYPTNAKNNRHRDHPSEHNNKRPQLDPHHQQKEDHQRPNKAHNLRCPNQHKKQGKRPKEKHFQKTPQAPNLPPLTSLRTLFNQANPNPHPLKGDVRKLGEEKTHYAEDQRVPGKQSQ
jgi:hypothetical protein